MKFLHKLDTNAEFDFFCSFLSVIIDFDIPYIQYHNRIQNCIQFSNSLDFPSFDLIFYDIIY